jgi:hypothetical protein
MRIDVSICRVALSVNTHRYLLVERLLLLRLRCWVLDTLVDRRFDTGD